MVDTNIEEVDEETAESVQEDIASSDEDVTTVMRAAAGTQLAAIIIAIVVGLVAAIHFGYLTPTITVIAEVNVGWFVEYFIIAVLSSIAIYIFALVLIVLPASVLNGLSGIAYGIAVAGGFVESETDRDE